MLAAITVLVTAVGASGDGEARAIEHALRSSLAADDVVIVRTDAAAAAEPSEPVDLTAVVTWSEDHGVARIHFTRVSDGRWLDREIRFDPSDAAAERGRTIGFALASMVPAEALRRRPPPEPPPPPAAAPPPAATPAPDRDERARGTEGGAASLRRYSVEAAAQAAGGIGGYGGGIGGHFAVRIAIAGPVAARAIVGARGADIAPAQATSTVFFGGAGISVQPWLDASHRWALGGRLDALAIAHRVVHLSADDVVPDGRTRLLPGLDAALEGAYRFADQAMFIAAVGSEIALGRTDVVVRDREVAEIAPVRAFVEAGLRVSF